MGSVDTKAAEGGRQPRISEGREKVDFKMITFSVGGKEYGIDIMKVKEISKIDRYTYVPNGSPFLRGVYNLRGDIIPIIDLRTMFHLSVKPPERGKSENVIILTTEEQVMGIIVDTIDKVVGIASERIKPPHPLFNDINIQYLSGVVELGDFLYIVLDVDRIFSVQEKAAKPIEAALDENEAPSVAGAGASPAEEDESDVELGFITETLAAFKGFSVTPLNLVWVKGRLSEWRELRSSAGLPVQLSKAEEADDFLESFFSPYTAEFWDDEYAKKVEALLPEVSAGAVSAWNPGCGKGYETYSVAAILLRHYAKKRVKVWANDNDLLGISMAPTLSFHEEGVPKSIKALASKGRNGYTFKQEIKDSILFEYHDIVHPNPFPDVDVIVARDILSFFNSSNQASLIGLFRAKLRPGGLLLIGQNERFEDRAWHEVQKGELTGYIRLPDGESEDSPKRSEVK